MSLSLSSLLWRPTQLYLKEMGKKIEEHFPEASAWGVFVRRFRPEEFSSTGDFGLGRNFRPKTPHFPERGGEGVGRGGGGRGRGGRGVNGFTLAHPVLFGNSGRRCRTCQLFYVDDFGNLIPIVNTHSVFSEN